MFASRRHEALRRGLEMGELADLARADAENARRRAKEDDVDEESRASMEHSAAEMDAAADKFQELSDFYHSVFETGRVPEQYDDEADGFS